MADLFAYTDGACSGNPGPGGWGVLLVARDGDRVVKERELKGGESETTNNRMELMAAITALETLDKGVALTLVTDSVYVKDGLTKWIHGWKKNGWKTAAKKPVKNEELWRRLDEAQQRHQITWEWIKGMPGIRKMNAPMRWHGPEWNRLNLRKLKPGQWGRCRPRKTNAVRNPITISR